MTICAKCGREFKRNPARLHKLCGSCRSNHESRARKAYHIEGKEDVLYNRFDIYRGGFPDGTIFVFTTTNGKHKHYRLVGKTMEYYVVGKSNKFHMEDLSRIYEWIKQNQPVRQVEIERYTFGAKAANVLDALDRNGYLTCEDGGLIYVYP